MTGNTNPGGSMKKVLGVAIGGVVLLAMLGGLAVVGYRHGWFKRIGLKSPVTSAGGGVAGGQETGTQPSPETKGQSAPGAGGGVAGPAAQAAALGFDGNVAALAWGGKVESATGMAPTDPAHVDRLMAMIDENPKTYWHSAGGPDPSEIVLSFCDHESVLIDQVRILSTEDVPRDVEV
jgi:hypothetical protein